MANYDNSIFIKVSKFPDQDLPYGYGYSESSALCPYCKNVRMWEGGWWDDSPEAGGSCIGTAYECGDCGHYESH